MDCAVERLVVRARIRVHCQVTCCVKTAASVHQCMPKRLWKWQGLSCSAAVGVSQVWISF
jgi:hypothetical protein